MWLPPTSLDLLRYLIVWRINSPLVQLPRKYLPMELARVLGTLITERLPTRSARPWRKNLAAWDAAARQPRDEDSESVFPDIPMWPLETVFFAYPGKSVYGEGEILLWELKLFGKDADHELFLEVILPAMEEAGFREDRRWRQRRGLWGHFDIDSVYVARSRQWEPLVQGGRLDLRYRPTRQQWALDTKQADIEGKVFREIFWLAPFDLDAPPEIEADSLAPILSALIARLNHLVGDFFEFPLGIRDRLDAEQRVRLEPSSSHGARIRHGDHNLSPVPDGFPGKWIGTQRFRSIPPLLLPYLELASILHVGRHTQFGCGTFLLR
jgi:hypothetical protein